MIVPSWRWRFVSVVACAAVSTLAGCALLFRLVTPESVGQLRTMELLGLLGLVVLPWVSLWAYVVDRRVAHHGARAGAEQGGTASAREPHRAEARLAEPGAAREPGRQVERHRRRADEPARVG